MAVLGLDGCAKGWVGVVLEGADVSAHFFSSVERIVDLLPELVTRLEVIAIDIPLGLLDSGPRQADVLARRHLARRASTIFSAPPRACLAARDYAEAQEISRRLLGKGLSKQSFALLPKIGEVDRFWRSAPCPVWEVHPELSFAKINDGRVLAPKTTWTGMVERRAALAKVGVGLDDVDAAVGRLGAPDDVLDAAVCAWSAREILQGRATFLPDPPEVDATGRWATIRV
jgi:predicted RNase H-like nuclease